VLQKIKSYIKFLFHSKNEHGLHSPFVYNLVTNCFYASDFPFENSKYPSTSKLILKTIHYFNLKECKRFVANQEFNTMVDGLIVSGDSFKDFSIEKILPFCKNETCIFIENIHQTKANEKIWKRLHQHETITCSIETFNLGFLFIRKEQKKEHFIINPNKTITSHLFERIRIKL
jgi:hypothetical protein